MKDNKKNITFFFGAGAEPNSIFYLPSGEEFLNLVIPKREEKNINLINALRKEYKKTSLKYSNWTEEYRAEVVCEEDLKKSEDLSKNTYGYMERYFHTLINPKKYGQNNFWKIINHYWFAFFSVFEPLYSNYNKFNSQLEEQSYEDVPKTEEYYIDILENISEIIKKLYSTETKWEEIYKGKCGYYKKDFYDEKNYNISGIITTNYTPLVNMTGISKEKVAFINGQLKLFEYPYELTIEDITENPLDRTRFLFPFLMVQSAIKPIIAPAQVIEMQKAYEFLMDSNYLVMIGYGINEDDNHINAFIVDFLRRKNDSQLIYCFYDSKESKISVVGDLELDIKNKLRLDTVSKNIKILKTNVDAEKLFDDLKKIISL